MSARVEGRRGGIECEGNEVYRFFGLLEEARAVEGGWVADIAHEGLERERV
jgi:hypothetical protein